MPGRSHGLSNSPEYRAWQNVKNRCYNPNTPGYERYGARGITMCERWRESFENFLMDMGKRPSGMSLERVDNSRGYSPDNCIWASRQAQQNNTRTNHQLTMFGQTLTVEQWIQSSLAVVNGNTFRGRIRRGWEPERALTTPATTSVGWPAQRRNRKECTPII